MPLYDYICKSCGATTDAWRAIAERDVLPACPQCGGETARDLVPRVAVRVFAPYQAVATDRETGHRPIIRTQAEHRAFLARNGYEEVGTDRSMAPRPEEQIAERRAALLRERAEVEAQPAYAFDPETHEAAL